MLVRRSFNSMALPPPRTAGNRHDEAPRRSPPAFPFVAWTILGALAIALAAAVIVSSPVLATLAVSGALLAAVFGLLRARRWGALSLLSIAAMLLALLIETEIAVALMAIGLGGMLVVRLIAMHEGWIPRRALPVRTRRRHAPGDPGGTRYQPPLRADAGRDRLHNY